MSPGCISKQLILMDHMNKTPWKFMWFLKIGGTLKSSDFYSPFLGFASRNQAVGGSQANEGSHELCSLELMALPVPRHVAMAPGSRAISGGTWLSGGATAVVVTGWRIHYSVLRSFNIYAQKCMTRGFMGS